MAGRARAIEELPDGLVEEVEARVRRSGAILASAASPLKLARGAQARLFDGLARRGLERTGRFVRVPLAKQLEDLLDRERIVSISPLSALKKRLAGAGPVAEVKLVVAELVSTGRARVVVRDGKDRLSRPTRDVLSDGELGVLAEVAKELGALLKRTRARKGQPPRSLWRADVADCIGRFDVGPRRAADSHERPGRSGPAADPVDTVLAAVARLESPSMPLVFIPRVARALDGRVSAATLRAVLEQAEREGRLELRPESGVGLLTAEEASLCPRAPNGAVLSYVRRTER
ncbi:MAG: hypothetical protein HYY06_23680 [Deltaproteobacteria bacterium]|nr:hypothetical protein [Deltaproteobacteria bacterium]